MIGLRIKHFAIRNNFILKVLKTGTEEQNECDNFYSIF